VAFEVYDVVDNQSDDWSAEVRVVVDTGSSRLIAPFIKEVHDMKLDMDELGDADLTFQIVALTADFASGDQIEMRLSGTTVNGDKVDKPYLPELISNAPSIVEFTRPSADVRALIGGVHTAFSYRLIKADGSPDLFSKTFSPRVIGLSTLLAAPIALDEIAGTLDPDLPRTQVDIPWNDIMVPGNVIMLVWEGMTASGTPYVPDLPLHPISDDEDGKTLEISVEGEHLKAIENGTLDLCYWLLSDAITRAAVGHKSLYAEQLRLGQPQVELPEPVVEGENGGVLDPADVPTTGTRLIVRQYDGQIEEDVVHILWWGSVTGRYRNQLKLNSITDKIDVPFTIRKALVDDNRNGTVRAMYWVKRANGRTSASAVLLMSIGAALDLSAPSVKQATGNAPSQQLNPVSAKDELTVVIPEYGINPGDEVSVTWAGTAGEGSYVTPAQELPTSREIDIPVEVIAYNLGRPVTVSYTVTRNGNESPPSAPLNLAVLDIPANELEPSQPRILEAANNGEGPELNVINLTGDATVRIDSWPLIAQGQRIWLRLVGTKDDGSRYEKQWLGANNWVSAEWYRLGYGEKIVPESELRALRDGSILTLEFKASLNQSPNEDQAVTFPTRIYTVRTTLTELPRAPTVVEANASNAIDPSVLPGGITVRVAFTGMLSGDEITLFFEGTANGSDSQTKFVGSPVAPVDFAISQATVLPNSDLAVNVFYEVRRGGAFLGKSLEYPLTVLGLKWNIFVINGWNTATFQPSTGFDGAHFQRLASRAIAPVTYASSRPEVTVDDSGVVRLVRAWTGAATISARDGAGRTIDYILDAPTKWYLLETLGLRNVPEYYAFVQANASKGYRGVVSTDWTESSLSQRQLGYLFDEWGNLLEQGWTGSNDYSVWLTGGDPGGTPGWRGGCYLNRNTIWSEYSNGPGRRLTICYRNNP